MFRLPSYSQNDTKRVTCESHSMETFQGSLESESIQGATHRNLICSSSGFSDRSYFANEEHGNRIYVRSHDSQCEESDRSQAKEEGRREGMGSVAGSIATTIASGQSVAKSHDSGGGGLKKPKRLT